MKPYEVKNERKADYPINKIFLERWSPRAMSGEKISEQELMSLFEAARWAPSSSNKQPWRFLYALRETPEWNDFFSLLVEFNQIWCKNAAALIVILSEKSYLSEEKKVPNITHSFDTGAAWLSLALEARYKNLIAHGMAGFDYEKARQILKIPENYSIEAMIAVGKQGEIESLPERMQKSEKPNSREKISTKISSGKFPDNWK